MSRKPPPLPPPAAPMRLAPDECIVCHTARPPGGTPAQGWAYLAGAIPTGAMVCGALCLAVALERNRLTGRVDSARQPS